MFKTTLIAIISTLLPRLQAERSLLTSIPPPAKSPVVKDDFCESFDILIRNDGAGKDPPSITVDTNLDANDIIDKTLYMLDANGDPILDQEYQPYLAQVDQNGLRIFIFDQTVDAPLMDTWIQVTFCKRFSFYPQCGVTVDNDGDGLPDLADRKEDVEFNMGDTYEACVHGVQSAEKIVFVFKTCDTLFEDDPDRHKDCDKEKVIFKSDASTGPFDNTECFKFVWQEAHKAGAEFKAKCI